MFLRESMQQSNQEQIAYLVTLCHDEWLEQAISESLEPKEELFDDWLEFIGSCAVKMSIPSPRGTVQGL